MALDVYLNNTEVTLALDLMDSAGRVIVATSVDYRVIDQDGTELITRRPVPGFSLGDESVTIFLSGEVNQIGANSSREIRTIELYCLTTSGTTVLTSSYGVEATEVLKVGINSYQGFAQAQLTAMDIPNIEAWDAATDTQRVQALIDARERINQLNFNLLNSNVNFGQDQLAYVPEGQFQSSYVARNSLFIFNGNLAILNPTQFAALPERFKRALRQAQVVEANAILGGEQIDDMRRDGIIEDRVGESLQKFRDRGVALRLPVCRRALSYLSYYVTFAKRIGRAG